MNTDRFLTRVFDKQEKKMLYPGDVIKTRHYESNYQGIRYKDIIISFSTSGYDGETISSIDFIPFGDRYVPMMCTGSPDKNKKLIYAGDILRMPSKDDWDKINFAAYEVFFCDNDSCDDHIGFRMNRVHYHGSVSGGYVPNFNPKTTSRMEIISNIHENEKLLEVKA